MRLTKIPGWMLLFTLTFAMPTAQAMPPHPQLIERIQQNKVAPLPAIQDRASLLERGIDTPHRVRMPMREVDGGPEAAEEHTNFKSIVLVVDFSDNAFQVTASFFDDLVFGSSTGTVNDYYDEVSYGNLSIVTVDSPSTVGWITMPQTYAYYVDGQNGFGTYPNNAQKLAEDAVAAADPYVDFSQYDFDGDGYVDGLFIVHAGSGAEFTGSNDDIWSHKWNTYNPPTVDGVVVDVYSMEPEFWSTPGDMTCGVYAHEMGHAVFGLPDLYDRDYSSAGIGDWSLMAGGSWNGTLGDSPAHPDAWCRMQMGFLTPTNVTSSMAGVTIPSVESTNAAYRLWADGAMGSEYFLIENRQLEGFDAGLPGPGLLVYHVDETVSSQNDSEWYPGYTDYGHYLVAVEQADGYWDLETYWNSGDDGDPFPGYDGNTTFDGSSIPSSRDYSDVETNVSITNITESGSDIIADLGVSVDTGDPLVPQNLFAGDGFDGMVPLTWEPPSGLVTSPAYEALPGMVAKGGVLGTYGLASSGPVPIAAPDTTNIYKVYRGSASGGPYSEIASFDPTTRNYDDNEDYIDQAVTNGMTYYYVVTYVDTGGVESAYSDEVVSTPVAGGMTQDINFALIAPTIDGSLDASEWLDATTLDITSPGSLAPVVLYMKNDGDYLYLAIDDQGNSSGTDYNTFGIYFDDDNSGTWDPALPSTEGNYWITMDGGAPYLDLRPMFGFYPDGIGFDTVTTNPPGLQGGVSTASGHIQYEARIDLASSALTASLGDTVGLYLFSYDEGNAPTTYYDMAGVWPLGSVWVAPASYGKVVLGTSASPPAIVVTPDSLDADLASGETDSQTLTIDNSTGTGDLVYSISVDAVESPMPGLPSQGWSSFRNPVDVGRMDARGNSLRRLDAGSSRDAASSQPPTLNSTRPSQSAPETDVSYAGTYLSFAITDYGEIMPFQYPIGNEHLLAGFYGAGYTVAYTTAGGDTIIAYAGYDDRYYITPVSYTELVNNESELVVEVVTQTSDGVLEITRRFTFDKADKFIRIKSEIANISAGSITGVVFKSWADWDNDYSYDLDNWDYDFSRNMVYVWETVYTTVASLETPTVMDIDGWGDYYVRDTYVDFPTGPVYDYDGLEILHFELGDLAPGGMADVTTAYGAGEDLADLQATIDRAIMTQWLTLTPMTGVVGAGTSADVDVLFDATSLSGGDYNAQIKVASNDPFNPEVIVPAHMHVTGMPSIAVAPDTLFFDPTFVGWPVVDTVTVTNAGTEVLDVSSIASDNAAFTFTPSSFSLGMGQSQALEVTFDPTVPGSYTGHLTLSSNDPDTPVATVTLEGEAGDIPVVSVMPESLSSVIFTAESTEDEQALTIDNSLGGGNLFFDLSVWDPGETVGAAAIERILERHETNLLPSVEPTVRSAAVSADVAARGGEVPDTSPSVSAGAIGADAEPTSDWQALTALQTGRAQHGLATSTDGLIYAFGGYGDGTYSSLEIYNPGTDSWSYGADMLSTDRGLSFATSADGYIYAFSGLSSGSARYNPNTDSWGYITNAPNPDLWEAGATRGADGKIYLIGGEGSSSAYPQNTVQIYDPSNDTWSSGSPMPTARYQLGVVAGPGGLIYAIGGHSSSDGAPLSTVEIYNPSTDSWSTGAPMPTARCQFAIVLGPDNKIYAIGGKYDYGNGVSPFYDVVEVYDPVNDSWTTGPALPMELGETEAVRLGGAIHVIGGWNSSGYQDVHYALGNLSAEWLTLSPASGAVEPGTSLDVAVHFSAASLSPGYYRKVITVSSNDPETPFWDVPVELRVLTDNVMPPTISSVVDVPEDQGGWAFVNWRASEDDVLSAEQPVAYYSVWLRNPFLGGTDGETPSVSESEMSAMLSSLTLLPVSEPSQVATNSPSAKLERGKASRLSSRSSGRLEETVSGEVGGKLISESNTEGSSLSSRAVSGESPVIVDILSDDLLETMNLGEEWIGIGSIAATRDTAYSFLMHTLQDSNQTGLNLSFVMVSAHGEDPFVFTFSDVDSGYSVDNIAPGAPENASGWVGESEVHLSWSFDFDAQNDFQYFAIYRSDEFDFVPESMDSITYVSLDTFFVDADWTPEDAFAYRIAAVDHNGNFSPLSGTVWSPSLSVEGGLADLPEQFALRYSYPNPFNASTTIRFDVPTATQVSLVVYDILGREVARLVDKAMEPGHHQVVWNARNRAGAPVSTGIYIVRMTASNFSRQMKMVLVR